MHVGKEDAQPAATAVQFKLTAVNTHFAPAFVHQNFCFLATGNKPPGVVPNKFMYMTKDLRRAAEYFDVPLQTPADPFEAMFKKGTWIGSSEISRHDRVWISSWGLLRVYCRGLQSALARLLPGSLSAMRFVTAVQEQEKGGDKLVEQLSRELWRRIWSEDKDITQAASLAEVPTGPAWLYLGREISGFW